MADDDKDFKGDDRRRAPRIKGAIVEYTFVKGEPYKDPAFIKDISAFGVCIYLEHREDIDKIVYLKIHLIGDSSPIIAEGKIVRVEKSKYLGFFELGIDLYSLDEDQRKRMENFIGEHLNE